MKTKFNGILTLLLAFVVQLTFAQEKTVSGTVVDESNMPLPGATVLIKGTATGTSTDFDGKYSISANQGDVLTFSYVGYANQDITVGSSNSIDATMAPDNELQAVVVTALGIKRKPDEITTANQVVDAESITQAEATDVVNSLAGKVSGLQINQTGNGVNPDTSITLRGIRSLTGDNEALVVIDGAVSSSAYLSALDPKTIESVNVIKGANGAALYGSKGGNGAIIVTTRKGAKGKDKVSINIGSSVQFQEVAFLPERQTTYGQGWNGVHWTYENGGWGPQFDGSMQPVGLPNADGSYNYFPYVGDHDNIKEFFQTGTTFQNNVSVSAGSLDTGYINLFVGNQNTEFVIEGDEMKRNTFSLKAGKKAGKWNLGGTVTYLNTRQESNLTATNADGSSTSLYEALLETPTNVDVGFYSAGANETSWNGYYLNPYWVRDNSRTESLEGRINGSLEVGYEFNEHINAVIRGNISTRARSRNSHTNGYTDPAYIESITGFLRTADSYYSSGNSNFRNIYTDALVNFDYNLTEDITFKANVGANITDNLSNNLFISGYQLTVDGYYNADNISTTPAITDSTVRSRGLGLFAQFDFGYKDYLFLNLTGRNDWTSVLNQDNRSFFYPSAGVAFIPTKAIDGLKGDILNYAKLSASYVKVGTADVGAYDINETYNLATGYPLGGLNSYVQSTSSTDALLQNQFVTSYEFNANLGFLKNRITLDGSYYMSDNTKQILGTDPSYASGLTSATINVGATETKGFEVDLGLTPIKSKNRDGVNWDINLSYATSKTTVKSLANGADQISIASAASYGFFAQVGEEFPLIMGTGYLRDDQGRVIINSTTGNPEKTSEFVKLGKTSPDYILGLSSSVKYKGFKLSTVMDYRTGHQFYSSVKSELARSGYLTESIESGRTGFIFPNSSVETSPGSGVYVANTSTPTGGTSYSDYTTYFTEEYFTNPENFVIDATAFKVRELSLSYSFAKDFIKGTKLEDLTIAVTSRNPFAKYADENQGYADPETSTRNDNGRGSAGLSQYPPTKFYGFSVNLTF